jgi:glycosidase
VDHLKRLGVTAIELLPIHAFIDDRHLIERGLSNYWGYNTLGFFAPEVRYAADGSLDAFRSTVSRLHDAGIAIILDVVYNHTAEGNHLGPTLNLDQPRPGIDAAAEIGVEIARAEHFETHHDRAGNKSDHIDDGPKHSGRYLPAHLHYG